MDVIFAKPKVKRLNQRITQHKSDCPFGRNTCGVVGHYQKTGYNFDYENVALRRTIREKGC